MKKIVVLVSTYNGAEYINDQINSILNQKIDDMLFDLQVVVRDDGSTDDTVAIVNRIMDVNENVRMLPFSNNLGFAKSFMTLLSKIDADYYFFSDQDDIWEEDKVNDFLSIITAEEKLTPICGVFSDAWISDVNANSIGITVLEHRKKQIRNKHLSFMQQVFDTYVAGASLCINRQAREKVMEFNQYFFSSDEAHDYFIAMVISCFGKLYFLDKPTLRYRQTGNNVYGARDMTKKTVIQRIKSLYSRVKNVQRIMYTGGIIMKKNNNRDLSNTLINISLGNSTFNERFNFFNKYKTLVSPKYPNIIYLLYAILMKNGIAK